MTSTTKVVWNKATAPVVTKSVAVERVLSGLIKTLEAPMTDRQRQKFIDLFRETLYEVAAAEWQIRMQTLVVPGEVYHHVCHLIDGVTGVWRDK